ncbi:HAD family hydrolase [uncultured Hyphomonas sp.]|uniref:HAD family hydrolase n=1 Tax=uncultured Hyphomonas sp. TaxID=225298 RepID=UPI002AAAE6E0|nr:HAD family hydrolase [uncultured Hyphomonas sp.]
MVTTRTILFDVDGVLIDSYHANPRARPNWDEEFLDGHGIDPARFSAEFIYGTFLHDVLPGRRLLIEALEDELPKFGYAGSAEVIARHWISGDAKVNSALLEFIAGLDGGFQLFLATNQDQMRADWIWNELGFQACFRDIFHAARFGAVKPTKEYFDAIACILGPQSVPPLLIDDSLSVVEGARQYGWDVIHYTEIEDVTQNPVFSAAPVISSRR